MEIMDNEFYERIKEEYCHVYYCAMQNDIKEHSKNKIIDSTYQITRYDNIKRHHIWFYAKVKPMLNNTRETSHIYSIIKGNIITYSPKCDLFLYIPKSVINRFQQKLPKLIQRYGEKFEHNDDTLIPMFLHLISMGKKEKYCYATQIGDFQFEKWGRTICFKTYYHFQALITSQHHMKPIHSKPKPMYDDVKPKQIKHIFFHKIFAYLKKNA